MERVLEKLPEHEWLMFVGLQQKLYFSSYSSSLLYIIAAEIGTGGGGLEIPFAAISSHLNPKKNPSLTRQSSGNCT